jgi:hypothetical protein
MSDCLIEFRMFPVVKSVKWHVLNAVTAEGELRSIIVQGICFLYVSEG